MGNFIEQSAEEIMLRSMSNIFMPESLDPVGSEDDDIDNDGDVDKSDKYLHKRRKAVGKAIAAEKAKRTRKEELELHLRTKVGEITEKKLYKSEKATNSDEKEVTIEEKPVKNTVVINPDVNEGLINTVKNFVGLAKDKNHKVSDKTPMGAAVTGLQKRRQATDAALKMLRQGDNVDGDLVEVKSGPITDRERIARMDAGKDPYPLKSAGEKERLSLGIKDIDMGVSPVKDGPEKFLKSLGLKGVTTQSTTPKKGEAPKKGQAPKGGASSTPAPTTKGKEGPKAKKLSTVDTGTANPANVQDTIKSIKNKLKTEATYPSDFVKGSGVAKKKYGRPMQHDQPMKGPVRKTIDEQDLKDEIQDILERTRYAKEKGKDFKTGKDSKKGGTRDGKSAFDKVSKEMRKTGGLMSSRGKAIQPQGKKKEKGKKGYKGVTPVDKIKNRLAQKRKPKKDPYWSRFD